MNLAMPPSELLVANVLRCTLPVFSAIPAFAPDLTKIMKSIAAETLLLLLARIGALIYQLVLFRFAKYQLTQQRQLHFHGLAAGLNRCQT